MSEVNQYVGCLYQSLVCVGPIIGVLIIWHIIRLSGLEYWARVPRQTRLRQWVQSGIIFVLSMVIALCIQGLMIFLYTVFDIDLSDVEHGQEKLENRYTILVTSITYLLVMLVGTFGLFQLVLTFMQTWISPGWVKWVTETYPERHREILLFASQGEERKKWRQNKNLAEFQEWVRGFVREKDGKA